MSRDRFVLHFNVADFAVAVERLVDSSLRSKPVIVAPLQVARAVVYDMSDEAYGDGVRKGMLLRQALRYCRSAQVVAPRFDLYSKAMVAFVDQAREYTPLFEYGAGDGHLFLDITGTHRLLGTAPDVGWRLRKQSRSKVGLDPIWSLGTNKLIAKVASRLVKPSGEYIVAPGEEEIFLAPIALALLPGLHSSERTRLQEFNVKKVGQLAMLSKSQLGSVFGNRGDTLYDISRGIDSDIICPRKYQTPVVSREYILADDSGDRQTIENVVNALVIRIAVALRTSGMACRKVLLQLNYTDGSRIIRQATSRQGISDDYSLRYMAQLALNRAWGRRTRVRSCRLTGDRLHRQSPQLPLFSTQNTAEQKRERLVTALDAVRSRFGIEAVRFGSQAILH